uniref:Fibronectin type-II domain-containing protein n=1 Tax=Lepisosteus oculatus TaxID=7918 RepID=W5MSV8_LEPOC
MRLCVLWLTFHLGFITGKSLATKAIITVGGNDPGKECIFPFKYEDKMYFQCIIKNNNNIPWCATTSDYAKDQKWGNCAIIGSPTTGGNSNGAPCQFPFTYQNKQYYYCTTYNEGSKLPWCATVSNYDKDPKWGYCPTSGIVTEGGNDPGKHCVFPFYYGKELYFQCTTNDHDHLWCATTSDYDTDGKWGNCPESVGGNDPGKHCVFPFYYEDQLHLKCTTKNNNHIPWCATTSDFAKDKKWGNCPFSGSPTTGGNSNGAPCQFPFIYQNKQYYYCTTENEGSKLPWCATVSNYDKDPKWGYCPTSEINNTTCIVTEGGNDPGKQCVFPFYYGKELYFQCTTKDHNNLWCATTSDFNTDRKWGNCPDSDHTLHQKQSN